MANVPPGPGVRATGILLLRGFAAAARPLDRLFRRLVGDNDLLRYFLWAALPLLLLAAVWLGTSSNWQTSSAPAATEKSPGAPFVVTVTRPIPAPAPVTSPGKEIVIDLGGGVKLEMALIPAGEFLMGSPDSDNNAGGDEKPQHRLRITRPFYLGKHLVTQEQWQAVTGNNPSHFKGPKNPVETVSWDDCQQFLEKLNAKAGPLPAGEGEFRLPTEAQWEYACRAGSTTRYCFGDEESGLGEYAWYAANSGDKTHPVGEKKPNAWGLYDMHGNVWEWCQDWYDSGYYAKSPTDDPTGAANGSDRVDRGGGWSLVARLCRSAHRYFNGPGGRGINLGLRVSRVAGE
ncbi:MAG: formylglycine-generating enzyme family protein [Thermoguttaceae bacterium]|jgi:formylglycine-generating enzyme required for sulfatase activity